MKLGAIETETDAGAAGRRERQPAGARHDAAGEPSIPDIVIRRLPIYVRALRHMSARGVESVSSDELAAHIGVTAAQIRRDLSYFGRFGTQGKGYDTTQLAETIGHILKLDREWDVALAGFGNLGRAIAHYRGFLPTFRVAAIFDNRHSGVVDRTTELTILPTDQITNEVRRLGLRIGIVASPTQAAQDVADRMVAGGIEALLNYTPAMLHEPPGVTVREIDPLAALESMTYYLGET